MKKKNTGNWIKNLATSIGYASASAISDLFPTVKNNVKANKEYVATNYDFTKTKLSNFNIKDNYIYQSGNTAVKNAIEDLKTGNLYNKKRLKKSEEENFGFNFGNNEDNFDFNSLLNDEEDNTDKKIFKDENSNNITVINTDNNEIIDSINNSTNRINKISSSVLQLNRIAMSALSKQVSIITDFNSSVTTKYYTDVSNRLTEIAENTNKLGNFIDDLSKVKEGGLKYSLSSSGFSKMLNSEGLNLEDIVGNVKKKMNFGGVSGKDSTSMLKMIFGDTVNEIKNNPLGFIMKNTIKALIPKNIKNSLTDLDNIFKNLPILLQGKMQDWKSGKGSGKGKIPFLKGLIGNLFYNGPEEDQKFNFSNYEKGRVFFDGVTRDSIVNVIPSLLSKILASVSNNPVYQQELVYDTDRRKFTTAKAIRQAQAEEEKNFTVDTTDISKYKNQIIGKNKDISDENKEPFMKDLDSAFFNMIKKGKLPRNLSKGEKFDSSEFNDITNNPYIAAEISKLFNGMNTDEKVKFYSELLNATNMYNNVHFDKINQSEFMQQAYNVDEDAFKFKKKKPTIDEIKKKFEKEAKDNDYFKKFQDDLNNLKNKTGFNKYSQNSTTSKISNFIDSIKNGFAGIFLNSDQDTDDNFKNIFNNNPFKDVKNGKGISSIVPNMVNPFINKNITSPIKNTNQYPNINYSPIKNNQSENNQSENNTNNTNNILPFIKNNQSDQSSQATAKSVNNYLNVDLSNIENLLNNNNSTLNKIYDRTTDITSLIQTSLSQKGLDMKESTTSIKDIPSKPKHFWKNIYSKVGDFFKNKNKANNSNIKNLSGKNNKKNGIFNAITGIGSLLTGGVKLAGKGIGKLFPKIGSFLFGKKNNGKNNIEKILGISFKTLKGFLKIKYWPITLGVTLLKHIFGKNKKSKKNNSIFSSLGNLFKGKNQNKNINSKIGSFLFGKKNNGKNGKNNIEKILGISFKTLKGFLKIKYWPITLSTMILKHIFGKNKKSKKNNSIFSSLGNLFRGKNKNNNSKVGTKKGSTFDNIKNIFSKNNDNNDNDNINNDESNKSFNSPFSKIFNLFKNNKNKEYNAPKYGLHVVIDGGYLNGIREAVPIKTVISDRNSAEEQFQDFQAKYKSKKNNSKKEKEIKGQGTLLNEMMGKEENNSNNNNGGIFSSLKDSLFNNLLFGKIKGKTGSLLSKVGSKLGKGKLGSLLSKAGSKLTGKVETGVTDLALSTVGTDLGEFGLSKLGTKIGEKGLAKVGGKVAEKGLTKVGGKLAGKGLGELLGASNPIGLAIDAVMAGGDAVQGWNSANSYFGTKNANFGQKLSSALGNMVTLGFGGENAGKGIYNIGSKIGTGFKNIGGFLGKNAGKIGRGALTALSIANPLGAVFAGGNLIHNAAVGTENFVNKNKNGDPNNPLTKISNWADKIGKWVDKIGKLFTSGPLGGLIQGIWGLVTGKNIGGPIGKVIGFFKGINEKISGFFDWAKNGGNSSNNGTKKLDSSSLSNITNDDLTKWDKSKITAKTLNNYIAKESPNSPFNGNGQVFIDAANASGLDPRYILAHAALESGWGTSAIAKNKNNYFGIGSFDSSPYKSSYTFNPGLEAGIVEGAKWISKNYTKKGQNTLYSMRNSPNGNHNYATDPNWANKIATIMAGMSDAGGYNGNIAPTNISKPNTSKPNNSKNNNISTVKPNKPVLNIIGKNSNNSSIGYSNSIDGYLTPNSNYSTNTFSKLTYKNNLVKNSLGVGSADVSNIVSNPDYYNTDTRWSIAKNNNDLYNAIKNKNNNLYNLNNKINNNGYPSELSNAINTSSATVKSLETNNNETMKYVLEIKNILNEMNNTNNSNNNILQKMLTTLIDIKNKNTTANNNTNNNGNTIPLQTTNNSNNSINGLQMVEEGY